MANLRSYLKEIESYLEQNQYDQAIAHCHQILKKYPNSVDALRLLGQAYLENKQIPESINCFEKVIAIIPDDFVSHVAFSSIKEDERDLDAAIFHMELAFDSQPTNNIVQDELKRLIGKKEGAVPDKITLSRGALIRMYAKGELFQQAINEINAALSANPQRIDFKILLAEMLLQSNGAVQSAEICNQVLESHPLCQKANLILHQIYIENGLTENAKAVLDRLTAIDPYYGWIVSLAAEVEEVPDEKVEIERLQFESAFSTSNFDEWEQPKPGQNTNEEEAIGFGQKTMPKAQDNFPLPGPFSSDSLDFESHSDDLSSTAEGDKVDDALPEFLKGAGWKTSTTPEVGPPPDIYDNPSTEAQKTDLPDWLKVKASDSFIVNSSVSNAFIDETVEVMDLSDSNDLDRDSIISSNHQGENQTLNSEVIMSDDNSPIIDPKDENSDWMAQFFDEAKSDQQPSASDKDLPDWLNNFGKEETSEATPGEELPSWLNSLDPSSIEKKDVPEVPPSDIDSILSDLASQPVEDIDVELEASVDDQSDNSSLNEEDISLRLDRFTQMSDPVSSPAPTEPEVPTISPEQPIPSVFEEYAPTPSAGLDEDESQIPDWVKSVLTEPGIPDSTQNDMNTPEIVDEIPPLVEKMEIVEESISESEGAISAATKDELLGWLREISPEHTESNEAEDVNETNSAEFESIISEPVDEALDRLNELPTDENPVSENIDTPIEKPLDEIVNSPIDTIEEVEDLESESLSDQLLEPIKEEVSEPSIMDEIPAEVGSEFISSIGTEEPEVTPQSDELVVDDISHFVELVQNGKYEDAFMHALVSESSGNDQENILNALQELKPQRKTDFNFMQFLGDILAKSNRFDEALEAYNRAEELLTQKQE